MLEAGRRVEHPRDLFAAEHRGQGARMFHPVQLARQVRAVERARVEEPQR